MPYLGEVPRVVNSERPKPWWLYPNLLSMDAPLVAVAWLFIFEKTWRLGYLPWQAYVSLGLVVWVIYVMDRLLDAMMRTDGVPDRVQARHAFHRQYRKRFLIGSVIASAIALVLVVTSMPVDIYAYCGIGLLFVAAFFALSVFSTTPPGDTPYAKNILAGFTFAYGTAMLAHVYTGFSILEMLRSRELICFGVLCMLNINAIDLWEHARRSDDIEIKATDELSLTLPLALLGTASLLFTGLLESSPAAYATEYSTRPFFCAILTGAGLLLLLNLNRQRFSRDAQRVLADVCVAAPFLVFLSFLSPR